MLFSATCKACADNTLGQKSVEELATLKGLEAKSIVAHLATENVSMETHVDSGCHNDRCN